MQAHGIHIVGPLIADGILHRYRHVDDSVGSDTVWAVCHDDEHPAAAFGDHKRHPGRTFRWRGGRKNPCSPEELARSREAIRVRQAQAERHKQQVRAAAADRANRLWNDATPCERHPYLDRKKVRSHGLRTADWIRSRTDFQTGEVIQTTISNALLIPIRNAQNNIVSLQAIFPERSAILNRDRDFLTGGEKRGCWFSIGRERRDGLPSVVAVTEGYATGCSVQEATGLPVAVAFDAGNLAPVAAAVRKLLPTATLLICGDDDKKNDRNTGAICAVEAARSVNGLWVLPSFASNEAHYSDWNDLAVVKGREAVRCQIIAAVSNDSATKRYAQ